MNQDNNKYPFPYEEEPIPQESADISDEIAADVAAFWGEESFDTELDAIVSAVEDTTVKLGTGLDAIMTEAGDPSLEIGADVEAIMAENGDFSVGEDASPHEVGDPTVDIGADVAAIMEEAGLSPMDNETPLITDILPIAEAIPSVSFSSAENDMSESEESTDFAPETDAAEVLPEDAVVAESTVAEGNEPPEDMSAIHDDFLSTPVDETLVADTEDIDGTQSEDALSEESVPEDVPAISEASIEPAVVIAEDATRRINIEDPFYHEQLNEPTIGTEISADEQAISSAGLIHPSDAELDRIIKETQSDVESATGQPTTGVPDTPMGDTTDYTGIFPVDTGDMVIQDYVDPSHPIDQPPVVKEEPEKPLPKRRPKMKKGYGLFGLPHIAATLIWLAINVAIGVSLGRMIWVCAAEVLAFGKPDQEFTVTITSADNIDTVAAKLKNAGLIKYPELFKLYAGITDAEEELSAGTFVLNSKYDYNALVKAMTYHSSARETVKVLIPEGYTCAQIFALLEEQGVCTAAELEEYAANGEIKDRWFLEGIKRGDKYCLEGYLFPDSYEFYTDDEPGRVLGKFLDNFDARFTDIMKDKIDPLNERMAQVLAERGYTQDYIDAHKFTIREIVIIASMIERETANDAESYDIASVIYNRLTNPANYPYLNIDATIIYALGGNIDPVTGKTKPLTKADLELDGPYNTYTRPGLIPGPISNPGRNSLNAALDPNSTLFYFYVYNPNISKHLFAKTADEHNKNVEYVRSLEENNE